MSYRISKYSKPNIMDHRYIGHKSGNLELFFVSVLVPNIFLKSAI